MRLGQATTTARPAQWARRAGSEPGSGPSVGVGGGRPGGAWPPAREDGGDDADERGGLQSGFAISVLEAGHRECPKRPRSARHHPRRGAEGAGAHRGLRRRRAAADRARPARRRAADLDCGRLRGSAATEVTVGDLGLAGPATSSAFDGRLATPTRKLAVRTDPRRHAARSQGAVHRRRASASGPTPAPSRPQLTIGVPRGAASRGRRRADPASRRHRGDTRVRIVWRFAISSIWGAARRGARRHRFDEETTQCKV